MNTYYISLPILLMFAPLAFALLGFFSSIAIVTSALAIIVIAIRLGFLAVEFSGGVALDFVGWSIKKLLLEHNQQQQHNYNCVNIKNHNINSQHSRSHSHHLHHINNSAGIGVNGISKTSGKKYKINHPHHKNNTKQHVKLSTKLRDIDNNNNNKIANHNYVSNDDYFMTTLRRPTVGNGRRSRSDYI
ncbi:1120_t:CDS:1 [Entrophospora sp. SA101]|nr:6330_t:CDS:1 [Entrophospora sp. SA101]CAJ0750816.1 1120_t:CDS:1 [Entrophospora sp. SA101]CAJ0847294.1 9855_t:CDS:1 [Entrophospora sp. SA101]CAJ0878912.1 10431_t:CDS:1 [Entrophospora sp. SA101]CAJ0903914.1 5850_t:CDS:1 [Entrophospora sp. SA101]